MYTECASPRGLWMNLHKPSSPVRPAPRRDPGWGPHSSFQQSEVVILCPRIPLTSEPWDWLWVWLLLSLVFVASKCRVATQHSQCEVLSHCEHTRHPCVHGTRVICLELPSGEGRCVVRRLGTDQQRKIKTYEKLHVALKYTTWEMASILGYILGYHVFTVWLWARFSNSLNPRVYISDFVKITLLRIEIGMKQRPDVTAFLPMVLFY